MKSNDYIKGMVILSAIILVVSGVVPSAFAAIPQSLSYQGKLVDPTTGLPVPDGTYDISFRIYDAQSGGTPLWQESQSVSIQDGIISVLLGANSALNLPFDQEYWLSVQVGTDAEMSRREISSVAYSFNAKMAEDIKAGAINTDHIVSNAVTANKIAPNIVSSINSASNDGGNIDLVAGENITIVADDTADTITISAVGGSAVDHGQLIGLLDDDHPQYALDTDLSSHAANASAHHSRYTDAEARAAADDITSWGHTNVVTKLNADRLDGYHASSFSLGPHVTSVNGLSGGTITSSVTVDGSTYSDRFYVSNAGNNNAVRGQNNSSYPTIWAKNTGGGRAGTFKNSASNYSTIDAENTGGGRAGTFENRSSNYHTLYVQNLGNGKAGFFNTANASALSAVNHSSGYATIVAANALGGYAGYFYGKLGASGSKTAVVSTQNYGNRELYCDVSTEIYFFDRGRGQLTDGEARIKLDPMFLEIVTINNECPMLVQVTATADCKGLFVAKKTTNSFTVKEFSGGASGATFDWEVAVKRKGYEADRMEKSSISPQKPH